jgi:hypothetical protein
MSRQLLPIVGAVLALTCALTLSAHAQQARLSSSETQTGSGPAKVRLEVTDFASGIDHPNSTDLVIKHSGLYFMMASVQVGSTSATGHVDLFIRVNGKNVANTNRRQSVFSADYTAALVTQGVGILKPGDVVSVIFSASNPSLGLFAIEPEGEPRIPSAAVSIFRFGD